MNAMKLKGTFLNTINIIHDRYSFAHRNSRSCHLSRFFLILIFFFFFLLFNHTDGYFQRKIKLSRLCDFNKTGGKLISSPRLTSRSFVKVEFLVLA